MKKALWVFLKWTGVLLVFLFLATAAFMFLAPQFGAKPADESLQRIEASPNQQNGTFKNLVTTRVDTRKPSEPLDLHQYIFPPADKNPSEPLPSMRFNAEEFDANEFVWFGHSTLMFRTDELTVLADPVFNRASPIPIGGKPFSMQETPHIDDLPDIDVVIISHDHYDHLDNKAISALSKRVRLFLVPLGIQAHLERWGVPAQNIIERDWYQQHVLGNTVFTLTPTRHFSGRGITNRDSTLWGAWVIKNNDTAIFFSGDTGYFDEFKKIGDEYGPFNIAFMENGAYDKGWSQIHMMPEESIQAAIDLRAQLFFPIHWGKFDLAKHQWVEPIERAVAEAKKRELPLVAPLVGQIFSLSKPPFETWWQ